MSTAWAALALLAVAGSFGSMVAYCLECASRVAGGERHLVTAGVLLAVSMVALFLA